MKRIFGIIFVLIVLAAFTPLGCFAEDMCTDYTNLSLSGNGDDYTSYTLDDSCNTTINDISISGNVLLDLNGHKLDSQREITCVSGPCSLKITDTSDENTGVLTVTYRIYISGSLEIIGGTVTATDITADGSITISGEDTQVTATSTNRDGIHAGGDIKISGGTVTATGTDGNGIYANGSITISGEDTQVTATGGKYGIYANNDITIEKGSTVTEASGGTSGIYAGGGGSITISGSTVNATGTSETGIYAGGIFIESGSTVETSGGEYGIHADGEIVIRGTVTKASGTNGSGIYTLSNITIKNGGTVTKASGGTSGIYAERNISIESGGKVVKASGGTYGIYAGDGITISGSTVKEASGGQYGIHTESGSITIESGGTVTEATGTNGTGIYAYTGDITIRGTVENATGGQYGIHTESGSITIESGGTVEMASGSEYGIYAGSGITIKGDNTQVTAEATGKSDTSAGIYSSGGIDIQGGMVNATGGISGIQTNGDTTISGGTVTATGVLYGIRANGSITIKDGGTVKEASGGEYGIYAYTGDITISGGTVTASGEIYGINAVNITIKDGGTVKEASGGRTGIFVYNNINISGGTVTAKATDTEGTGIYAEDGSITIESGGTVEMASGSEYGIYAGSGITIKGDNTQVNATGSGDIGIYAYIGNISISGGTVTASGGVKGIHAGNSISISGENTQVTASGTSDTGIDADNSITISGGTVSATGGQHGIHALDNITINGGTVKKASGTSDSGIYANGQITISDVGTVEEASSDNIGIYAGSGITISGTVTASGNNRAVSGTVKNAVSGIGWTNKEGTEGKALIGLPSNPDTGQSLDSYKKVLFPAPYVTKEPAPNDLTYNGSSQELVTAGTASGGTMKYALGENDSTAPAGGWSESIPEKTDAQQTYYVWYKVSGVIDNISIESVPACVSVTIAQKSINNAAVTLDKTQLTYNGSEQSVNVTKIDGLSVTADDFTVTGNTGTNADDYTAAVTGQGNFTGTATAAWSIAPKPATVTAIDQSIKKGEDIQTGPDWAELEGAVGGNVLSAVTLRTSGTQIIPSDAKIAQGSAQPKGDYTAPYDIDVTDNYNITYVPGTLTVVSGTVSYQVTFRVMNGAWNDGSRADVTVTLSGNEGDTLKLSADQIPGAGSAPDEGFKAGSWDTEPDTNTPITRNVTYIYSYVPDETPEPEPERPGIDFFRLHADCGLPATGFSSLRPTVLPEQPKDLRYEPVRMHLMLPTLDRDVELVTMPREGNSWAAAWLGADAGILEGSALPGEGVSVIAGHNTLNDTDYGPFALLSTLEVNDTVMVREESGALKLFRVYANELLEPDDMERLSALAGDDALVLLTCENESPSGGYLNRRAVFAR